MMTFNTKDRDQKQIFQHVRMGHSKETDDHGVKQTRAKIQRRPSGSTFSSESHYVSGSADRERMHNIA
jgi:hypothetical protein